MSQTPIQTEKKLTIILEDSESKPTIRQTFLCDKCGKKTDSGYHANSCPQIGTPPPPEVLGRSLDSVKAVMQWLSHPSNHVITQLFVVKWDGIIPKISTIFIEDLWRDKALAECIIVEQINRKKQNRHERERERSDP